MVIITAGGPADFTPQIRIQNCFHAFLRSGGDRFDAELVEVFEGPRSHPSGDHYLGTLLPDELRHYAGGGVAVEIGIVDHLYIRYGIVLDVHNRIVGAPPKMGAQ